MEMQEEVKPPQSASGLSSPFVSKMRDLNVPCSHSEQLHEKDAQKLFTVDNPANLYIHGQLRKKLYKNVAMNFHEAAVHSHFGASAPRAELEGFTEQFM